MSSMQTALMFGHLQKHSKILVTGPHRSGTTICAKMIAHDTGHDLLLEDEFWYSRLHVLAAYLHADYGPVVVQCPFLAHIVHDLEYEIGLDMEAVLVIFMHRYRRDIIASEERARLKNGRRVRFDRLGEGQKRRYHTTRRGHVSDLRYESWEDQCKVIPHALDVGYESLRDHPLWIEKRDFSLRQTSYDEEPDVSGAVAL